MWKSETSKSTAVNSALLPVNVVLKLDVMFTQLERVAGGIFQIANFVQSLIK